MDVLQTPQTELEKARATSLCVGETQTLGGRVCLTTSEGADKQTSEMTEPLLRGGSCSEGEEGEEEFAEREARVGDAPVSCARFSDQDVVNVAGECGTGSK